MAIIITIIQRRVYLIRGQYNTKPRSIDFRNTTDEYIRQNRNIITPLQEFLNNSFVILRIGILAERVVGEKNGVNISIKNPRNPPFISPDDSEISTPGLGGPTELTGLSLRVQSLPQN